MSDDYRPDRAQSRRRTDVTSASELGEFAYCRRGWWLSRVKGLASANLAAMAQGRLEHEAHGRSARRAYRLGRWALLALIAAVAAMAAGLFLLSAALGGRL